MYVINEFKLNESNGKCTGINRMQMLGRLIGFSLKNCHKENLFFHFDTIRCENLSSR